mmetsp:Transcript_40953/g.49174  ORF Transcript_40953/g.49174 Transcript_40953/m.49174 type:complete len:859 (-) Transcript_40953:61-2637(-)
MNGNGNGLFGAMPNFSQNLTVLRPKPKQSVPTFFQTGTSPSVAKEAAPAVDAQGSVPFDSDAGNDGFDDAAFNQKNAAPATAPATAAALPTSKTNPPKKTNRIRTKPGNADDEEIAVDYDADDDDDQNVHGSKYNKTYVDDQEQEFQTTDEPEDEIDGIDQEQELDQDEPSADEIVSLRPSDGNDGNTHDDVPDDQSTSDQSSSSVVSHSPPPSLPLLIIQLERLCGYVPHTTEEAGLLTDQIRTVLLGEETNIMDGDGDGHGGVEETGGADTITDTNPTASEEAVTPVSVNVDARTKSDDASIDNAEEGSTNNPVVKVDVNVNVTVNKRDAEEEETPKQLDRDTPEESGLHTLPNPVRGDGLSVEFASRSSELLRSGIAIHTDNLRCRADLARLASIHQPTNTTSSKDTNDPTKVAERLCCVISYPEYLHDTSDATNTSTTSSVSHLWKQILHPHSTPCVEHILSHLRICSQPLYWKSAMASELRSLARTEATDRQTRQREAMLRNWKRTHRPAQLERLYEVRELFETKLEDVGGKLAVVKEERRRSLGLEVNGLGHDLEMETFGFLSADGGTAKNSRTLLNTSKPTADEVRLETMVSAFSTKLERVDELLETLQEEEWADEEEEQEQGVSVKDSKQSLQNEHDGDSCLNDNIGQKKCMSLLDQILAMIMGSIPRTGFCYETSQQKETNLCYHDEYQVPSEEEHFINMKRKHETIVKEWIKEFGRLPKSYMVGQQKAIDRSTSVSKQKTNGGWGVDGDYNDSKLKENSNNTIVEDDSIKIKKGISSDGWDDVENWEDLIPDVFVSEQQEETSHTKNSGMRQDMDKKLSPTILLTSTDSCSTTVKPRSNIGLRPGGRL